MSDVIGIIGLGYVGLPLAAEFGKKYRTIGFDILQERIEELNKGIDRTLEVSPEELSRANHLEFTADPNLLKEANIIIVTVPTPVDKNKKPDLTPLLKASRTVGGIIKKGDIIIFESTVYPGATEEDCVPIIEEVSGLKFNQDFYCGYSPERINPGDKTRRVADIKKITSGSTPEIAEKIDQLYKTIITAGTHKAASIKVAEAAKVIENCQRDINIAFVNELALIFDRLGIDTTEVLEAASTKWNFLPFKPGLVGGHCIGVDPYYLAYKAEEIGFVTQVIMSGRRINDNMGPFIANKVVKMMIRNNHKIRGARALVLGITFKENCPDIRNSRAIDVVNELKDFGVKVDVYDPWADNAEVKEEYGFELVPNLTEKYDAVILAVAHKEFLEMDLSTVKKDNSVLFDVKSILPKESVSARL